MGETRVDLLHLLEDLRDAYPGAAEETILTEIVANGIDSGAATVTIAADPAESTLTILALATAMALAPLAVEPAKEHAFLTTFLAAWGSALARRGARRRK